MFDFFNDSRFEITWSNRDFSGISHMDLEFFNKKEMHANNANGLEIAKMTHFVAFFRFTKVSTTCFNDQKHSSSFCSN